eukprot:scaffold68454_cov37-Tisochrysis_lutea.AAC.1
MQNRRVARVISLLRFVRSFRRVGGAAPRSSVQSCTEYDCAEAVRCGDEDGALPEYRAVGAMQLVAHLLERSGGEGGGGEGG